MREYVEPDCHVIALDIENVICGSLDVNFDAVDQTELFEIDDIEFL